MLKASFLPLNGTAKCSLSHTLLNLRGARGRDAEEAGTPRTEDTALNFGNSTNAFVRNHPTYSASDCEFGLEHKRPGEITRCVHNGRQAPFPVEAGGAGDDWDGVPLAPAGPGGALLPAGGGAQRSEL